MLRIVSSKSHQRTLVNLMQSPEHLAAYAPSATTPHFVSRLSAGFPSPATDYMEDGLDLNAFLIRHKASTFLFDVKGYSMLNAGIVDGDKVLVDRSLEAKSGQIVVAVVNGEYTLKRLYLSGSTVELRAENPEFKTKSFQDGEHLEIWGVVVGVVRRYPC
jgi:DNA polymerase V